MEREHWTELSAAIRAVAAQWKDDPAYHHPQHVIVGVYCWAAIHDRSVNWATQRCNWVGFRCPAVLPDQSTMSRRTRRQDFTRFLHAVAEHLATVDVMLQRSFVLTLKLDGKPLEVASHSSDVNATFGRGAGRKSRGYKLHAIWGSSPMPLAWLVAPLNVSEKPMARRLLKRLSLRGGCGYLLADGYYDCSVLFDRAAEINLQLLAPRQHAGKGLGHHYQSPHRQRSIALLENPHNRFGSKLHVQRKQIEREFGNLSSFGGGLSALPPWVRRYWRVRNWVHAKLLINSCRIRCNRRRKGADA